MISRPGLAKGSSQVADKTTQTIYIDDEAAHENEPRLAVPSCHVGDGPG